MDFAFSALKTSRSRQAFLAWQPRSLFQMGSGACVGRPGSEFLYARDFGTEFNDAGGRSGDAKAARVI